MARPLAFICATLALFLALPVHADAELDGFARDVERVEGVRAVKTLQSSYAQYAQYGLWNEVGALFARNGSFVFDGMIKPAETAKGPRSRTFWRRMSGRANTRRDFPVAGAADRLCLHHHRPSAI